MHQSIRRNLTLVLPALLAGSLTLAVPAMADDAPKPAKKDTALALKPPQATLTTSVEPAEAKPGETVSFKVTAKLDAGFHVYKYSKENVDGPVPTSFDFFDRAGLETDGDWKASAEPEKHKDPNFPDLATVEYSRRRSDLDHQAQGSGIRGGGKENAPLPGALHDLR